MLGGLGGLRGFQLTVGRLDGVAKIKVGSRDEAVALATEMARAIGGDVELEVGKINEPWDIGIGEKPENAPMRYLLLHKATPASEAGQPRDLSKLKDERVVPHLIKALDDKDTRWAAIDALDEFAATGVGPEMRDLLQSVIDCVRAGDDLAAVSPLTVLRPGQAAERLGMSRTHLYKLLDQGEIVSHRVGRDRRILLRDLIVFEERRQRDRRELAERFASQSKTREGAIDELADLL